MEHACKHIAIIMDGNGRWAKKRFLPRSLGHRQGVKAVKRTVKAATELGVEVLTLYAFSTENWVRPEEEVSFLVDLFAETLQKEFKELTESNVRISFIGDLSRFPQNLFDELKASERLSQGNTGLHLVIALNYGARYEIVAACKKISQQIRDQELPLEAVTEQYFHQQLALGQLPAVDLLIRTSGEKRLSNYLLWQLAYTELYFTDCHWPDFNAQELTTAIEDFNCRQRRYGAL